MFMKKSKRHRSSNARLANQHYFICCRTIFFRLKLAITSGYKDEFATRLKCFHSWEPLRNDLHHVVESKYTRIGEDTRTISCTTCTRWIFIAREQTSLIVKNVARNALNTGENFVSRNACGKAHRR